MDSDQNSRAFDTFTSSASKGSTIMSDNPAALISSLSSNLHELRSILSTNANEPELRHQMIELQNTMKQMCQLITSNCGEIESQQTNAPIAASSSAFASSSSSASLTVANNAAVPAVTISVEQTKSEAQQILESSAIAAASSSVVHPYASYFRPHLSQELLLGSKVPSPDCMFSLSTDPNSTAPANATSSSSSQPRPQLVCSMPVNHQLRLMEAHKACRATGKFVALHSLEKALNCHFDQQYFATLLTAPNTVREALDYFLSFEFVFLHSQPAGSFAFQRVRQLALFLYCNSFAIMDVQIKQQGNQESRRAENLYNVVVQPLIEAELKLAAETEGNVKMDESSGAAPTFAAASTTPAADAASVTAASTNTTLPHILAPFLHPDGGRISKQFSSFLRQIGSMHRFLHECAIASNQFIQQHTLEMIKVQCIAEMQVLIRHFPKVDLTAAAAASIRKRAATASSAPSPSAAATIQPTSSVACPHPSPVPQTSCVLPRTSSDGEESVLYIEVDSSDEEPIEKDSDQEHESDDGNESDSAMNDARDNNERNNAVIVPVPRSTSAAPRRPNLSTRMVKVEITLAKLKDWNYDFAKPRALSAYEFAYLLGVRGWTVSHTCQRTPKDRQFVSAMVFEAIRTQMGADPTIKWEDCWDQICPPFRLKKGEASREDFLQGYAAFASDYQLWPIKLQDACRNPPMLLVLIAGVSFFKKLDALSPSQLRECQRLMEQLNASKSNSAPVAASHSNSLAAAAAGPTSSNSQPCAPTSIVNTAEMEEEDMFATSAQRSIAHTNTGTTSANSTAATATAIVAGAAENLNDASSSSTLAAKGKGESISPAPALAQSAPISTSASVAKFSAPNPSPKHVDVPLECDETMSDIDQSPNKAQQVSSDGAIPATQVSVGSESNQGNPLNSNQTDRSVEPSSVKRELPSRALAASDSNRDENHDDDDDDDDVMIIEMPLERKSTPSKTPYSGDKPSFVSAAKPNAHSTISAPTSTPAVHPPAKRVDSTIQEHKAEVSPLRSAPKNKNNKRAHKPDFNSGDESDHQAEIHEEDNSESEVEDTRNDVMNTADDEEDDNKQQSLSIRSYVTPSKNTALKQSSLSHQSSNKRQRVESVSVLDAKHISPQPTRQYKSGGKPPIGIQSAASSVPMKQQSISSFTHAPSSSSSSSSVSRSLSKPTSSSGPRVKVPPGSSTRIITKLVKRKLDVDEGNVEDESKSNQPQLTSDDDDDRDTDREARKRTAANNRRVRRMEEDVEDMEENHTEVDDKHDPLPVAPRMNAAASSQRDSELAQTHKSRIGHAHVKAAAASVAAAKPTSTIKPKIEKKKPNANPFANLNPESIALRNALIGDDVYEISSSDSSSDDEELKRQFIMENKAKRLSSGNSSDNSRSR